MESSSAGCLKKPYDLTIYFMLALLFMSFVESFEVGDVCSSDSQCDALMECRSGRCTCGPNVNMIPVFVGQSYQTGVKCLEKKICDYRAEPRIGCDLGFCVLEKGEFHGVCSCEENSLLTVNMIDNSTCWPHRKRDFNKICGHASPMCDEMKGLNCWGGHCLCKSEHYYNFTVPGCYSKQVYMEMFNITGYAARWGDYCLVDDDCLGFLECAYNRTCECPFECDGYVEEHQSCYCGDWEFPTGPVIVGVLLGLVIISFWCYQIDKLCKKYQVRPMEPRPDETQTRYEELSGREEEVRERRPPINDAPPEYEATVGAENQDAPSAPPFPVVDDDRPSVSNQPVPLRKRKLPTNSADPQHTKM